jgi:predicted dehydrogenase/nucleoside-diphosphate-sugar epimerase
MMIRAGFVGAGYIAEYHLAAVRRLENVELVGVVDADREKAESFAKRAGTRVYASIGSLREAGAEVIHVLTPPHTHSAITLEALRADCHVLVEKPLAVDVRDCAAIRAAAEQVKRRVCVNHSLLFDPQVRRALAIAKSGKLGRLVSVDIFRSSSYPPYRGGPLPPHYREAGYPFRDLGVHALYLLQAFLGSIEDVTAKWASLGGDLNLAFDEWRALVRCRNGFGQLQLSWNSRPLQSQIIVQGTKGVLRADLFSMTQGLRSSLPVPKAVERVLNAYSDSLPTLIDVPLNIAKFLTKRSLPYHGLQELVRAFYVALENETELPASVTDAIPVVEWTEKIARQADTDYQHVLDAISKVTDSSLTPSQTRPILVTGASGNLGGAITRALGSHGQPVRIFVRRIPPSLPPNTEVVLGNLGDAEAVDRAITGCRIVIHAGAATGGEWADHECATIQGTRNVLKSCRDHNVDRLVYISSMSVCDWAGAEPGAVINENSGFEPRPDDRGAYTKAKLQAERLVKEELQYNRVPTVILRPGKIFGPRAPLLSSAIGWKVKGRWLMLGDGNVRLPLVYIDDVVDAVLAAVSSPKAVGAIVQVTDRIQPTQNEVLRRCVGADVKILHLPRFLIFTLAALSQVLLRPLKRKSPVSIYRIRSGLARRSFESLNANNSLGWSPRVGVWAGIDRELNQARTSGNEHGIDDGSVTRAEEPATPMLSS